MSILEQIKSDQVAALKSGNKFAREKLTTLFAECQSVGKNKGRDTTDEECIAKVKVTIENLKICMEQENDAEKSAEFATEISLISGYIPQQMTSEEIREIVIALKMQPQLGMKEIMAHFKENYAGRYDGKVVSDYAKKPMQELTTA